MAKGPFIFGQVRLNQAGRIDEALSCLHCGDALRGLSPDTTCPGCGKPVADSVRGDLLRFQSPSWLTQISGGLLVVAVGIVLALACGSIRFAQLVAAAGHLPEGLVSVLGHIEQMPPTMWMLLYVLPTVVTGVGLWFVAARQPLDFAPEPPMTWRRAAQWLAAGAAGLAVLMFVADGLASGWGTVPGLRTRVRLPWMFTIHVIWVAAVLATHVYAASLARRAPDLRLTRGILRGAWITTLALTVIYLYMDFTPVVLSQYRVSHTLADEGLPGIYNALVFTGYAAYLLVLPAAGWTLALIVGLLVRIRQASARYRPRR